MLKHVAAIIILSIIVLLAMPQVQHGLNLLLTAHDWIANILKEVFSAGNAGNLSRQLIALLGIPVIVGFIPALSYWLAKRMWLPFFMEVVWVIWLIQTSALVVLFKAAPPPT